MTCIYIDKEKETEKTELGETFVCLLSAFDVGIPLNSLSLSLRVHVRTQKKKKNYTTEAEQMEIGKACKWRGQVRSAGNPLNINNNINMDIN